jgi:hypothetical protein
MSPKRIFRIAYHSSQRSDPRFRIHQLRDGDAFAQLSTVLYSRGYEYGGLLLNLPSESREQAPHVDVSFLTSSDLVVLNTRPPIDDKRAYNRHPVRRSYTKLEDLIFDALKPKYLKWCARSQIILPEAIAGQLYSAFREKADIQFHSSHDSSYLRYRAYNGNFWQKAPADEKRTAVYLIQIPAMWPGGPGLLAAFGMAGTETLAWNYLLRTRFREWVDSYQFVMAEVLLSELPDRPIDLSFADYWKVTPMLCIPFSQSISKESSDNSPQ